MFKDNSKLKLIFFLGFLLSSQLAFTSYVNSSFLSLFSSEHYVGLIYIASSLTSLFVLFFTPRILNKLGEYKFLLLSGGLNAISLLLLSIFKSSYSVIPVFIFYFTLNNLIIFALDELIQIFSKDSSKGKVRGLYLTLINLAWVLAQAILGFTLTKFSFPTLYLIAFTIMAVLFFTIFFTLKNVADPKYDRTLAWQSFKNFFANKKLLRAYKINFLLQFFYVWMVIYTPIYLLTYLNFNWKEVSIMFTIMLLPFVFIQFPLGKYSDKIGERKSLLFGFFIASLSTLSLFLIERHEVWIWALALFCTRIGAATIEVMSDVYFFKHIEKENDEFIAIFRNAAPLSYVLAPLLASIILIFIPSFNYIFLILGTLMLYGVYLALSIEKNDI